MSGSIQPDEPAEARGRSASVDRAAGTAEPAGAGAPTDNPTPEPPTTGNAEVDQALADLAAGLHGAPAEAVQAYERVHQVLTETLSSIDQS